MKRYEIINALIEKYQFTRYLEIGVDSGTCIRNVKCEHKDGVDPNPKIPEVNYPMRSDVFFGKNQNQYDIVFIDGLHESSQVDRDIENALKVTPENGVIVLHDCKPETEEEAQPIRTTRNWNGDVYRSVLQFQAKYRNHKFFTVDTDWGVGIIIKNQASTTNIPEWQYQQGIIDWNYFDYNKKSLLNLISTDQFLDWVRSKEGRVLNCFPYFNERELLELRIRMLQDQIDQFIIIDANRTHHGTPKEYTCRNTLESLGLMSDKINVVELDLSKYDTESNAWIREQAQRDEAYKYIGEHDVCFVTDCDEIMDPKLISRCVAMARMNPNHILRLPMSHLSGRADLRAYRDSAPINTFAPFVCLKSHLNRYGDTLSGIRNPIYTNSSVDQRFNSMTLTETGNVDNEVGWHFTWMGDQDRLKLKNESFAHWNEVKLLDNYIPTENSTDALGRTDHILKPYPIDRLPEEIVSGEYPHITDFLFRKDLNLKINHIYHEPQFGESWFTYPNLYSDMVKQATPNSKFVEVGSWKGKSSAYMAVEIANSGKPIEFICVDNWSGSIEHRDLPEIIDLYQIFESNMAPLKSFYKPIISNSLDAAKLFEDESLDFVFIDASHEYEDVKQDILAWYPKVKPGGVLAGHDYYVNSENGPGVKQAVNEIFSEFETSEDCFIVKKN